MQTSRLFEILYLLMDKKKMTAAELAERLEVSKRTILRDITVLMAAGVPLYTLQGKGGGIALMDNYVLSKTMLTEDEQDQILFALQSLAAMQNDEHDHILGRLQSLFQKTDSSWIEVDFSRWGSSQPDKRKFELLKQSVLKKQALRFDYVSTQGTKSTRTVFPLKLIFKSRSWYLQAFCAERQDYRTFKISRILRMQETGETFVGKDYAPPPLEAPGVTPDTLTAWELVFPPHVAHRVYDEFDEGSVEEDENGWLQVSARMPDDEWLGRFLLSFGEDVHIIRRDNIAQGYTDKLT